MGQQGSYRNAAHSRYAAQQPGLFRPQWRAPNRLLQSFIELGQLFAQPAHVRSNASVKACGGAAVPIAFGSKHFDHLPATCDQCHQFTTLRVGQRPIIRLDQFGEVRQDACIDRIGLRQPASRAHKVADLARIDHGDRQPAAASSLAAPIS